MARKVNEPEEPKEREPQRAAHEQSFIRTAAEKKKTAENGFVKKNFFKKNTHEFLCCQKCFVGEGDDSFASKEGAF